MLMLANTTDKFQLVTDAAVSVDVAAFWADYNGSTVVPGRSLTAISTATTTDIVAAPASSTYRKLRAATIRNHSASSVVGCTMLYNANGTTYELYAVTLRPGETLEWIEGVGFFTLGAKNPVGPNVSTADQSIGASATAYLTGSAIVFPANPTIGTVLRWMVQVTKTAAATATETWSIYFGTNGTTADTARNTFTGDTETAAADDALVEVLLTIRGPISASCIAQATWMMADNLTTTGFSNTARKAQVRLSTSSAFDVTPTPLYVGLGITTGASHALTVKQVLAEVVRS